MIIIMIVIITMIMLIKIKVMKYLNDFKAFIKYSNDVDDI